MPEARSSRVSTQRVRRGLRVLAAAFVATAFLFSAAQAATAKKPAPAKKPAVEAEAKTSRVAKAPTVEKRARGGRNVVATYSKRGGKAVVAVQRRSVVRVAEAPARRSFGQLAGLRSTDDLLDLKSSVALVVDQDTREVLFSKNEQAVLPIASITKLMTGVLISEAQLPSEELITITQDDVDTEKHSSSRLRVGSSLPRGELLHLALMSSENRAAHALGRTYPGGMDTFVAMMNAKARSLGMRETRYVEPTGLSSANQSSARDLAVLVNHAYADPVLRQLTTSPELLVEVGSRTLHFNTTNRLVKSPDWDIGLQKTGYISEAGQCLVMQARIAGRKVIMVFLDSAGRLSRLGDAERVRRWVEATHMMAPAASHTPVASANVAG